MFLVKNNPSWPDHADFNCPKCDGAIEDVSDYDYGSEPNHEPEKQVCPHCKAEFLAHVEVVWTYKAGL